jgi:predicted AAA+ superfamily ATPase
MKQEYLPRIADEDLNFALKVAGAVLIEGPKWCGKTRTARQRIKSEILMQDPDNRANYKKIADTKPSMLLKGENPRLIDEWQTSPVLWDAVRHAVDERGEKGLFILTGSAVPLDNVTEHTGTGRITRLKMRTMSLFESKESNGSISLKELFDNNQKDLEGFSTLTIEKLSFALSRGGWPASINETNEKIAIRQVYDYVEAVINYDVSKVDGVEKSPARVRALMRSLARNVSTMANLSTIRNDISASDESISENTAAAYINALRRLWVIEDLPAWSPALRSKTTQRTSPKRHFIDPSIAAAVLRATPESLLADFNTFGLFFESLAVRDLRIYAQSIDGEVFHYNDRSGLEADMIVHLKDGRWAAIEVKMGANEIDKAAKNLITLKEKVNTDKMKEPTFLMVLTAGEMAYKRADGVLVVPIGCLKN